MATSYQALKYHIIHHMFLFQRRHHPPTPVNAISLIMKKQGSADQRVFRQHKACVLLASISTRRRAESAEATIALLRWRRQCHRPPPLPPSIVPGERLTTPRGSSGGCSGDTRGEEAGTAGWGPAAAEEEEGKERASSAAAAHAETRRLAKVNAEILEVNR